MVPAPQQPQQPQKECGGVDCLAQTLVSGVLVWKVISTYFINEPYRSCTKIVQVTEYSFYSFSFMLLWASFFEAASDQQMVQSSRPESGPFWSWCCSSLSSSSSLLRLRRCFARGFRSVFGIALQIDARLHVCSPEDCKATPCVAVLCHSLTNVDISPCDARNEHSTFASRASQSHKSNLSLSGAIVLEKMG